ncbi:MAG: glycosyltransferase family 2 protein [Candidatus Bathyarchaeota archaeon]|nr:glycosyltransferase family 2 protein [Candidatus Termiticorpusculum sp.]
MFDKKKRALLFINLFLSIAILLSVYVYRLATLYFRWWHFIFILYGLLVIPYIVSSLVHAHKYCPINDTGYRPTISVIIPCYKEGVAVTHTISAVLNSDYPKDKLDLMVVDDGSTDNTPDIIAEALEKSGGAFRFFKQEKNMGKRHALAFGVEHAIGEFVVCIDSDAVIEPNALSNLVQPFADPKIYCVCGNAIVTNEHNKKNNTLLARFQKVWYTDGYYIRKGAENLFGVVLCCSGVLSAFRKDKIKQILPNWLDETFMGKKCVSGEDAQLTNWMLKLGGKSVFQSNAVVYTAVPANMKTFVKQQIRWGRGSFYSMITAAKIFLKRNLTEKLIFYSNFLIILFSPFMLFFGIISITLFGDLNAIFFFIAGYVLIGSVSAFTCKMLASYFSIKDVFYRICLFVLMMFLTFTYFYSWLTIWREKTWGTR